MRWSTTTSTIPETLVASTRRTPPCHRSGGKGMSPTGRWNSECSGYNYYGISSQKKKNRLNLKLWYQHLSQLFFLTETNGYQRFQFFFQTKIHRMPFPISGRTPGQQCGLGTGGQSLLRRCDQAPGDPADQCPDPGDPGDFDPLKIRIYWRISMGDSWILCYIYIHIHIYIYMYIYIWYPQ